MTQRLAPILTLVAALVLPGLAAGAAIAPQAETSLFDGTSFDGWVRFLGGQGDVDETWTIRPGGVLACTGKPRGYIRTVQAYKDYHLRLEYRWPGKTGNNGVLVHLTGPDQVWPKSLECQGMYGNQGDFFEIGGVTFNEHEIGGHRVRGRRVIKLGPSHEKEPGQWNVYEVWAVGATVRPYVNGHLMNEATDCNITEGPLCLQSEGAPIEFRNITIGPATQRPWPVRPTQRIQLCNGRDLDGWVRFIPDDKPGPDKRWTVDRVWSVSDGVIHCTGQPNGYLRTAESYADYHLHLEWRWPEKPTNSGVLLHRQGSDKVWPHCIEAQLQDQKAGDFWLMDGATGEVDGKRVGGQRFFNVKMHQASSEEPAGQWNRYDIVCAGGTIKLWVNGVFQNELAAADPAWGPLCLQSEGGPIAFRNIYLEPADASLPFARVADPDPARFAKEIEAFGAWDRKNSLPDDALLLLGSSSIRMWPSAESFPDAKVVNRGFGGAHISDLLHYQREILTGYPAPRCVVFYCGGNDVAGGKGPAQVIEDFDAFLAILRAHAPRTPLVYIPIKPCPRRWALWDRETEVNDAIRRRAATDPLLIYADTVTPMLATGRPPAPDLFIADGLHLSPRGYALWTEVVTPLIARAPGTRAASL